MKPAGLLSVLLIANLAVSAGAIYITRPKIPKNFTLQSVSVQQPVVSPSVISGRPNRISFPSVGINVEVKDGEYDIITKEWTLSDEAAHYALITAPANNSVGNTFIYGHNRPKVFRKLEDLAIGEKAIVTTANSKVFTYTLLSSKDVDPTDVSVFEYQGPARLTVQTCTGTWYEKRRLYTFEFNEVSAL